jgi:hypothetical protein
MTCASPRKRRRCASALCTPSSVTTVLRGAAWSPTKWWVDAYTRVASMRSCGQRRGPSVTWHGQSGRRRISTTVRPKSLRRPSTVITSDSS